jgi:hypothetical protein
MYAVTGELPAAQGCRPTETVSFFVPCARAKPGRPSASDAAPAVAMKWRRETPLVGFRSCMMVTSSGVVQTTVAR